MASPALASTSTSANAEHKNDSSQSISIFRADDFHIHLRDGIALSTTVPAAAAQFSRCIVMPNLKPPVTTTQDAIAYRTRIMDALKKYCTNETHVKYFQPLMTLYLTDQTTPQIIQEAHASGIVFACKLYPAGATTNSQNGVTDIEHIYPALREMAKYNMPLCVHGEVTDPNIDLFDREAAFIEQYLKPLVKAIPQLKIVMEHITTEEAAEFVTNGPDTLAATITVHHLLYNRNAIFIGGIRPHYYCLPVLKREKHRLALIKAACSGNKKFFAGTDSAPHAKHTKEAECGCAGCYTAHAAVELYAEVFHTNKALDKLNNFMAVNGATFYGLPVQDKSSMVLEYKSWTVPSTVPFGDTVVVPIRAGESVPWTITEIS